MRLLFPPVFFVSMSISLTCSGQSSQDNFFSLYFESDQADGMEQIRTVPDQFFGEFKLVETEQNSLRVAAGDILKVDESGVYIEKNRILNISREEIRENSQYLVRDGYLHGVLEDDSVQVALDGELYYFLIPVKTFLFEAMNDQNTISSTGRSGQFLVLSEAENEFYTSMIIEFTADGVQLKELDHDCKNFDLKSVEVISAEQGEITTYYIEPNEDEWNRILDCHLVYDSYSK